MDHDYIQQSDLVDQYVMGKLTTQESEQFEEHFIDCPLCIDRLKTARDFRHGLELLSLQQTIHVRNEKPEFSWAFLRIGSWKTAALAACSLLLAACIGLLFLVNNSNHLRSEAEQAKSASLDWQRQYEEQQQSSLSTEQQRQKTEQELREQVLRLDAQLKDEQNQHSSEPGNIEGSVEVNPQILQLESTRESAPTTKVVRLSRSSIRFFLMVSLGEQEPKYKTYRLTIKTDSRVWLTKLAVPVDDSLGLSLRSKAFSPGNYELIIEGIIKPDDFKPVGNYPFRVEKLP
jgi:hypothetical protein